jgi:hypothetical protein
LAGETWGLEAVLNADASKQAELVETGHYMELKQYSFDDIAIESGRIDLVHVDIQGAEKELVPQAMPFLNEKVAYVVIGTHSRQIEGVMFDASVASSWSLEI